MVSKAATLDVVENVIDVVDDTAETLERIPNLALNGTTRKQQVVILTAVAVGAAAAGGAVSHLVTKRVLGLRFDAQLEEEIEAARRHYQLVSKADPDLETPIAALEKYVGITAEYDGSAPEELRPDEPSVTEAEDGAIVHNVFIDNTPVGQWVQEVEESKRSEDEPYVISREEHDEGQLDYNQETLTFYEGDDTLSDQQLKAIPVHEVDLMVGEDNLLRFGHGSGDPNVVYIRNDRLEMDYEVVRAKGKYAREVGFIEHSDGGGSPRKFRRFDG